MSRLLDIAQRVAGSPPKKGNLEDDPRYDVVAELFENPHLLDWGDALKTCELLLDDCGLDARTLGFGGAAAYQVDGWAGLADAFGAWNLLLGEHWETARPDGRRRMPVAQRFVQTLHRWLVDAPSHLKPGDPDPFPAVTDHAHLAACREAAERFLENVEQRFEGKVRVPRDVLARIVALEEEHRPGAAPAAPAPTPPPPPPPVRRSEPAPPRDEAPPPPKATPPEASAPAPSEGELDDEEVEDGLRKLRDAVWPWAEVLAKRSPAAPESWRLARDVAFAAFTLPPGGTFIVPEMPDVGELTAAVKAGNPARLLETAEAGWRGHLAWLDPHRHAADALRAQGHTAAADAVTACMRGLVDRIPALLDASYQTMGVGMRPDGTVGKPDPVPTANEATKAWLTAKPEAVVAAPAAVAAPVAGVAVAAPPPVIVRTTLAVAPSALPTREPPDAPDLEAFDAAMSEAKLPEALAAFSRVARSTRSPRARAWMGVHAARALLTANRPDLALPILLSVDDDARVHALDAWEPDLAAEILGNILDAARVSGSGVGDARLEDTRARLVRLGDLRALTDER